MDCILQEIRLEVHDGPFWHKTMSLCVAWSVVSLKCHSTGI